MKINRIADTFDLHCHYRGQTNAQPCYLEIDCEQESMTCDYNAEIGNAVPGAVWHGHVRRYPIPCLLADAANDLMDKALPLAERVLAGYDSVWDGHNHVARLGDDALAAEDALEHLCADYGSESERVAEWDAGEWLGGGDIGITARTTDTQLAEIARQIEFDAESNMVINDLDKYLLMVRDRAREDASED